jgi:hypothetical protein
LSSETITLGNATVTIDAATLGKCESVEITPEILDEEVFILGHAFPLYNLVKGRRIRIKLSKVHVDDTYWDKYMYATYPAYSKALSTTTIVFTNVVSSASKTHTFTITGPQIMKCSIKGDIKGYYVEEIEITGTGCSYATT